MSGYDDILSLPHHQSETRPHMPMANRAAQFSPFSALSGYEDAIGEVSRRTEAKIELSESEKDALDRKLSLLTERLRSGERPVLRIRAFVPDAKKDGGAYRDMTCAVRGVELTERRLLLDGGRSVALDDILCLEGELFRALDG